MSDLIAITYDDAATATQVRDRLFELQKEKLIALEDAVVVENKEGKIKLHQVTGGVGTAAAGGAVWGGLIGLIFLMPFLGAAMGAAGGAAFGATSDPGINDDLMRRMGERLGPGKAALFLLVSRSTPDKVLPQIAPYGGEILQTSLSTEQEDHLRDALRATGTEQAAPTT